MKKKRKVLFIAAHPDDETLGCGGSILRHKSQGDKIYWLIVTAMSKSDRFGDERIRLREKEIRAVAKAYNFSHIFKLNLPATRLDRIPLTKIIEKIARIIKKIKAEIVYLPHLGDLHTDHQITHKAILASIKSFRAPSVKKVFAYETVSETEFALPDKKNAFVPNVFVDITPFIDKKIKIMKIYKDEIKRFPFPRSEKNLRALATFRGARMGVRYAEAFMVIEELVL
jgi:LmbE family N-acetylglucosaminyl deacetylase